jgi:hypothetical protein
MFIESLFLLLVWLSGVCAVLAVAAWLLERRQ